MFHAPIWSDSPCGDLITRTTPAAVLLLTAHVGCVRVYQPLRGLHDPRIVDPSLPNFSDLSIDVYCVPGKSLKPSQASILCQRVGTLFENQAATVETFTQDPRVSGGDGGLGLPGDDTAPRPPADLVVELRTTAVHKQPHPLSWGLCYITGTIVPAVGESTFIQQAVVRDASGYLLARSSYEGRIVRSFGIGTWGGNKLLDLLVRAPEDELTGEGAKADLSADMYAQLSQVVYNAQVRTQMMSAPTTAQGQ